eukprot:767756-Hanusia_phi.AAC.1
MTDLERGFLCPQWHPESRWIGTREILAGGQGGGGEEGVEERGPGKTTKGSRLKTLQLNRPFVLRRYRHIINDMYCHEAR